MPEASRDNAGKPKLSELHWFGEALVMLADHCERGRTKYPDVKVYPSGTPVTTDFPAQDEANYTYMGGTERYVPNWTLGGKPDAEYLDAIERHLGKHVRGELYAEDMGTLHLIAIAWNALACVANNYSDRTSRPPTEGPLAADERQRLERTHLAQQEFGATVARFKVGDKVFAHDESYHPEPREGVVTNRLGDQVYEVTHPEGHSLNYYEDELQPVVPTVPDIRGRDV